MDRVFCKKRGTLSHVLTSLETNGNVMKPGGHCNII